MPFWIHSVPICAVSGVAIQVVERTTWVKSSLLPAGKAR